MNVYKCLSAYTAARPIKAEGPSQAAESYARYFCPCTCEVQVERIGGDGVWFFNVVYKPNPSFTLKLNREKSSV